MGDHYQPECEKCGCYLRFKRNGDKKKLQCPSCDVSIFRKFFKRLFHFHAYCPCGWCHSDVCYKCDPLKALTRKDLVK